MFVLEWQQVVHRHGKATYCTSPWDVIRLYYANGTQQSVQREMQAAVTGHGKSNRLYGESCHTVPISSRDVLRSFLRAFSYIQISAMVLSKVIAPIPSHAEEG